jgi:hypothetical protein
VKLATTATTKDDGNTLVNAHAGYPFPIPKAGKEIIWNQAVKFWGGFAYKGDVEGIVVDRSGRPEITAQAIEEFDWYYYRPGPEHMSNIYKEFFNTYGPPRLNGEMLMFWEPVNYGEKPRLAWQYLPGQRRVKLAPDFNYDTPCAEEAGVDVFDEIGGFNGPMDRYDWKILGKKEMYIPYNDYRAVFYQQDSDLGPHFFNPDAVRYELHRCWVVEATLKPGKRHVFHKRTFYVDEDSWGIAACDNYDANGTLVKANLEFAVPLYQGGGAYNWAELHYDLVRNLYLMGAIWPGFKYWNTPPRPEAFYNADAMVGKGVR